ncbi:LacI family DNA-binding transcriptional regulator [Desulfovibrio sp.]|uniref:LacI family DNA-binding transcriptional regulator n=1 Tax=Desulfovibrio sp. TaxID=885 RepID=UPI0023CEB05D|nr:LacI family DNA-binding transcriptional regulator [Desulfovibrio sp.]MDE7242293.1 LacI family transcriptional regulator [Desulfovibrio sp.]
MSRRVTLADVSRKTGLSQATVSMILSRRPDVSFAEETVRLVRAAAEELGYAATRRRAALFARRTVMVVCPFIRNYYYSTVVQALQSEAAGMECNVLVYTTYGNAAEEARILRVMAESDVGGVVFAMMPQSRQLVRRIARQLPIVIMADREGESAADFVELHNYEAGALVARHLAGLGHTRVICISTPLSPAFPVRAKRFEGLRDAWAELCPEGKVSLYTSFASHAQARDNILLERRLGRKITAAVLEEQREPFTAIVAINDMMAYGALDALAEAGLSVPRDCSVCGCDNDFPSDLVGVSLTSVEHSMARNAKEAFRLLYSRMAGGTDATEVAARPNIRPELVPRASTGAPRT